jgi:hypothetical protein
MKVWMKRSWQAQSPAWALHDDSERIAFGAQQDRGAEKALLTDYPHLDLIFDLDHSDDRVNPADREIGIVQGLMGFPDDLAQGEVDPFKVRCQGFEIG